MGASSSPHEVRRQRTEELLEQSLKKASPLAATLGVITVDLVRIGEHFSSAILSTLEESTDPLGDLEQHHHAMETYLKVVRQIDRLSALGQREAERSEIPAC